MHPSEECWSKIEDFQDLIERIYLKRDSVRGIEGTHMWFMEEVGELTRALRRGDDQGNLEEEFADVLAWLATMASMSGVNLAEAAAQKYADGCPGCTSTPCSCL